MRSGRRRCGLRPRALGRHHSSFGGLGQVRIWWLRTVYDMTGIGFQDGLTLLRTENVTATLVPEVKLPVMERMKVTGKASNGDVRVTGRTIDRVFTGSPLLLQLDATLQYPDENEAPLHRPELEALTSEAESILGWALPHVIGAKLGDSMFSRLDTADKWDWLDVSKFSTSSYYEQSGALADRCEALMSALHRLPEPRRQLVLTGLRWWRYAMNLDSPADEVVAYWISIESVSSALSAADSVRQRAFEAIAHSFPSIASDGSRNRVKGIRDLLYDNRCAIVHSGRRDLSLPGAVTSLASTVAAACIRLVVDGETSEDPPEHLLTALGI